MSKFYGLLAVGCVATVLATGGMVGYLMGTGKLSRARLNLMAQVLQGAHDDLLTKDPNARGDHAVAASQPATTEPATTARDTLQTRWQDLTLVDAQVERAQRDVQAQLDLLNQARQDLIGRGEAFEARQKAWEQERKARASADDNAGFKREIECLEGLPPSAGKDYLVQEWRKQPADAVRIVAALSEGKRKRILELLKTPEEQVILQGLLERLRSQDKDPNAR